RQPGFTVVVLGVLSVVIGLHATLASVLAGVLLRPWPGVTDPARVAAVYTIAQDGHAAGLSLHDARDVAQHVASLSALSTRMTPEVRVGDRETGESAAALLVGGGFFDTLGIPMARGRVFIADENRPDAPRAVAILSFDYWQRRFGGDSTIVGTTVRLN